MLQTIKKVLFLALMVSPFLLAGCSALPHLFDKNAKYAVGYQWEGKSFQEIHEWVCEDNPYDEECLNASYPKIVFVENRDAVYDGWYKLLYGKGDIDAYYKNYPKKQVDDFLADVKAHIVGYYNRFTGEFVVQRDIDNCEIESQIAYAFVRHIIAEMDGPVTGDDQGSKFQLMIRHQTAGQVKSLYFRKFCMEK